jgi:hypothetical protein
LHASARTEAAKKLVARIVDLMMIVGDVNSIFGMRSWKWERGSLPAYICTPNSEGMIASWRTR